MDYRLTIVVRFTTEDDLAAQLCNLDFSPNGKIELLCIGCGTPDDFEKAKKENSEIADARFEYVEGDYALARTRAAFMANGEYVLFTSLAYEYNWGNALKSIEEARSLDCEAAILRSRNRARIPNRKRGAKPVSIDIESAPENFFQAYGCTLAYTAMSRAFLQRLNENPLCEASGDSAFIVAAACSGATAMISGTNTNSIAKNERDDDDPKQDVVYCNAAFPLSVELLLELRGKVLSEGNPQLLDSFYRVYASRIRTYLLQNTSFEIRKPVLDIISSDGETVSFFLDGEAPQWTKASRKCFEFSKTAIRAYRKIEKTASYDYSNTKVVEHAKIDNPRVSMIVPVYNASEYLEETLRSALDQTYQDFELICVDDGSTDDSLAILKSMASESPRIAIYAQPNMGQSVARNAALEVARGDYIYFFDSDDLLDPQLLELCMSRIDENDLDMVLFDATTFYESTALATEHDSFDDYYRRSKEYASVTTGTQLLLEMRENREYRVSPCMYVSRSALIADNKIEFVPGIIHEDNAYTFQLMNCAERVSHINRPLYLRRVHSESVMTSHKTFENAYGYFVCARILLSHDFKLDPNFAKEAYDAAIGLSYSMVKLAVRDLLEAENGQEGGAYALDDSDFRMFCLLVLDAERPKRKLESMEKDYDALKDSLAREKERTRTLEKQLADLERQNEKGRRSRLLSHLKPGK